MSSTDELYQQVILDHNRHPRNFRPLPNATHRAEGFNPVCGDHYTVGAVVDAEGVIREAAVEGECPLERRGKPPPPPRRRQESPRLLGVSRRREPSDPPLDERLVEAADAGALARHRRGADVVDRDRGSVRLFSES